MFPGKPKRSRLLVEAGGSPGSLAQSFQPAAGVWLAGPGAGTGMGAAPDAAADAPRAGDRATAGVSVCRQVGVGVTRPLHVVVPVWWLSDVPMCSGHLLRGEREVSVPFLETGPSGGLELRCSWKLEGLTALGHQAVGKHRLARGDEHAPGDAASRHHRRQSLAPAITTATPRASAESLPDPRKSENDCGSPKTRILV